MAETSFGFDDVAGDRVYSAAQFMDWMSAQNGDLSGVIAGIGNNLAVTSLGGYQTSTNTGACVKGGYTYRNSAAVTKTHDAVTSGLKRYDVIVVRRDEVTTRTFLINVIKGTEGASPSIPSIGSGDVNLATIYIDNTSGTPAYTVTDNRQYVYGSYAVKNTAGGTISALTGHTNLMLAPTAPISLDITAGGVVQGIELTLDNTTTNNVTVTTISGGTFILNKGVVKLLWNGSAWELLSNGGCISRVQFNSGTAATWKMPFTGRVRTILVGGGGGGAGGSGAATAPLLGGGGGGGGNIVFQNYTLTSGVNLTYTIGGGGAGGAAGTTAANAGDGTDGTNSTCTDGTTLITARGGKKGLHGSALGANIGGLGLGGGGAGSPGTGGTTAAGGFGVVGMPGETTVTAVSAVLGGVGGDAPFCQGTGGVAGVQSGGGAGGGGGGAGFESAGGAGGNGRGPSLNGLPGGNGASNGAGGGGGGTSNTAGFTGGAGGAGAAGTLVIEFI